ncbi:MAG TPA: hypothetical protein DCX07_07300, partial [Phycisphaerales bacterium]|nr:hypothetical protein [Phycisphaerales bacterium]
MKYLLHASLALALLAAPAAAQDEGIHLPSNQQVGFYWYATDGAGFRWDVTSYGTINDGTNNAYDGAMQMRVNGQYFNWSSSGNLSPDGREVEIGPWPAGSLRVYRRLYIDPKAGYCRWIDIFENASGTAQTVSLRYTTDLGVSPQQMVTSGGKGAVGADDWGLVTGRTSGSYTATVHVWATERAKLKPKVTAKTGNDNVYYDFTLKVPAGKTVALCFFEAQRNSYADAEKFLKTFRPETELGSVPPALRKLILNMGGGSTLVLGSLELPRNEKHDLAVLQNDNELLGQIVNESFRVRTFYGTLDLPAARVVGLAVRTAGDPQVHVALTDGQVVAGEFVNGPLRFRLTTGDVMSLSPADVRTAAFRLDDARPEKIEIRSPILELRDAQRLFVRPGELDLSFRTEYGVVRLPLEGLAGVMLDTPEGGLHNAVFTNGSTLSGLLEAEKLDLALPSLSAKLSAPREILRAILLPGDEDALREEGLAEIALRNDNQLLGQLADAALTVRTGAGEVTITAGDVAEVEFIEEGALGRVNVKQHSGSTVSGTLSGTAIRFRIAPGLELPVFVGHIRSLTCPQARSAASQPDTQPATEAAPPAGGATKGPVPAAVEARRLGKLEAATEIEAKKAAEEKAAEAMKAELTAERLAKLK